MIPKDKEGVTYKSEGSGRPFNMPERSPIEKNDAERQKAIIIDLEDLNGQEGGKGMPVNFVKKAGRVLESFTDYWTEDDDEEDGDDIQ